MPTAADRAPRCAAVAGASSGIGRALALALADAGHAVLVGARREDRLASLTEEIAARGGRAIASRLDVRDPDSVDSFFATGEQAFGPLGVTVNAAAAGRPGALDALPAAQLRDEIETTLLGPLLLARRAIRALRAARAPGDLVFVSSSSAALAWPYHTPYAAAKAGIEHAARCLALELEGTGIRCIVARVGNTAGTEWAVGWGEAERAALGEWARLGLLRHAGLLRPEEVAQAIVAALATPRSVTLELVSVQPTAPRQDAPGPS